MANEPVPEPYPVPQVEVYAARSIGYPIPQQQTVRAPRDSIPEAEWVEATDATKGRSIGSIIWDSSKWLMREAVMPAIYKLVPQGAQELANGLFTGNPYWPGGATQQSVSIAEPSGPEIGPPAVEPLENYPRVAEFEEMVSLYAARGGVDQSRGIDR